MARLEKYEDFIQRVNELGFMTFSNALEGFPSLTNETPGGNWYTGNPQSDPWQWKDRAAEEKKLAFGCILGGFKGFIASHMYPLFLTACRPEEHMEELQVSGQISPEVWRLWQLFERSSLLSTSDIRHQMGVTKRTGSKVDRAIMELERMFYITVAGNRRKTDKLGQPFGWASNVYDRVESWAPEEWLEPGCSQNRQEAREMILKHGLAISENVERKQLAAMLRLY